MIGKQDPINLSLAQEQAMIERMSGKEISVSAVLDQRGNVYGSFEDNSRVAQELISVLQEEVENRRLRGQAPLQSHEWNALVMIFEKASRIMTGKPHEDNWIDIAGYAELGRNPR